MAKIPVDIHILPPCSNATPTTILCERTARAIGKLMSEHIAEQINEKMDLYKALPKRRWWSRYKLRWMVFGMVSLGKSIATIKVEFPDE